MRLEGLFTESKNLQICFKCENIIFDIVCWTSDHSWKNNKKMEETYELWKKTGKSLTKEVINF